MITILYHVDSVIANEKLFICVWKELETIKNIALNATTTTTTRNDLLHWVVIWVIKSFCWVKVVKIANLERLFAVELTSDQKTISPPASQLRKYWKILSIYPAIKSLQIQFVPKISLRHIPFCTRKQLLACIWKLDVVYIHRGIENWSSCVFCFWVGFRSCFVLHSGMSDWERMSIKYVNVNANELRIFVYAK